MVNEDYSKNVEEFVLVRDALAGSIREMNSFKKTLDDERAASYLERVISVLEKRYHSHISDFCVANLGLFRKYSKRFSREYPVIDIQDIESAAGEKLYQCAESFDPETARFSTLYVSSLYRAVKNLLRDHETEKRSLPREPNYNPDWFADPRTKSFVAPDLASNVLSSLDRLAEKNPMGLI